MAIDTERLAKAYVNIRDARAKLSKEYEEADSALKAKLTLLEAAMLDFLNETKQQSARTDAGTFYKQEDILPTGSDWSAFYDWVKQEDAFDALERRIKKTFIADYMEQHDGEAPPGVSVQREWKVRVRRSKD